MVYICPGGNCTGIAIFFLTKCHIWNTLVNILTKMALVPPGFFTKLTTPHATRPGCAKTLGRASHLLEAKTTKSASSRLAFMDNLSLCARTLLEDQECDVLHLHALWRHCFFFILLSKQKGGSIRLTNCVFITDIPKLVAILSFSMF